MSLRFEAIHKLDAEPISVNGSAKITVLFGENVFTQKNARQFLSDEAFKSLQASVKSGQKIDRIMANQIANIYSSFIQSFQGF